MEGNLPTVDSGVEDCYQAFHTFGSSSTVLDASPFPDTYKKERTCFICEVKLCSQRGEISRRHGCKFCLHAVCPKCSPLRQFHPLSNRLERSCLHCFKTNFEDQLRAEFTASQPKRDEDLLELSRKLTEETKKRVEYEEEISHLRMSKNDYNRLKSELNDTQQCNLDLETRLQNIESDFETYKIETAFKEKNYETSLLTFQQSVDKHRKLYALKAAELMGVRKQLDQYKTLVEGMKSGKPSNVDMGIGMLAAKQIHDIQTEEMKKQTDNLQAKLDAKTLEYEAVLSKLRDTENNANDTMAKHLIEKQNILKNLEEVEMSNENLKEEISELREQLERVAKTQEFDQFKELKTDNERRLAALQSKLDAANAEKKELAAANAKLNSTVATLTADIEELRTLLDLAKEQILTENQEKTVIEGKVDRFASYIDKLESMDSLQLALNQETAKAQNLNELVTRQRLEIEQYKQQLRSTQEALDKGEELLRAGEEQYQYQRKVIYRKTAEIDALREMLQRNGVDPTGLTFKMDGESDLTRILKEKEAKVGELGLELQNNLKNARGREKKPRPSGDSKGGLGFKPAVNTEPCACALF